MKYLYWLLGIVVIGGVGYVAYQYGAGNLNVSIPTDSQVANDMVSNNDFNGVDWPILGGLNDLVTGMTGTNSGTGTNSSVESATWKTYTNKTLGFSIQYPSSYAMTDNLQKSAGREGGPNETLSFTKTADKFEPTFYLWVNPVGFGPFFADVYCTFAMTKTGATIDKWTVQDPNEYDDPNMYDVMCSNGFEDKGLNTGTTAYMTDFSYKTGGEVHEATLKQILASLKNL